MRTTITVIVDPLRMTTTVRRAGEKCPIACIYDVSPTALSSAYRDAAEYLIDLANRLDGIKAAPALDLHLNRC
nr:MAG TPA: hypothetical protein [Caudoviricetes sp.]